ncbi:MAG: FAD-binding protein [Ignavibacteria bacterium GWA2_35_8]|nr:MAG: FAD-binding protein [Ignavibacteria bacterium GWA2_35_8]
MMYNIDIILSPKEVSDFNTIKRLLAKKLEINEEIIIKVELVKKSLDARNGKVNYQVRANVYTDNESIPVQEKFVYKNAGNKKVLIIGAGPAGLFASLRLLENGIKPIIIERGKDVHNRKKDIALLNRNVELNKNSNYCFGEGGAGTFSDGKLFTRSSKRGDVSKVLKILNLHGAKDEILYESHPHIGSDKLPKIIENIRATILNNGGEFHFDSKVTDFIIVQNQLKGVIINDSNEFFAENVILATGHSSRDIYELLYKRNIHIEAKPFALGVRIEHPQELINEIQYGKNYNPEYLPNAIYSLVNNYNNRGTYSFCMCPGGFIVPASTESNEMVVNGMSPSSRNTPYANSGIVVELKLTDFEEFKDFRALCGLKYQNAIEQMAFNNGGLGFIAPAQRLTDFITGKLSQDLPFNSYIPGVVSSPIHFWLPEVISSNLKQAFLAFDKKMRGYITNEAIILGVESRTSSAIRISRNKDTLEHLEIKGLYPCGEGAGYAGGIVSSAIDGDNVAQKIIEKLGM